MGGASRLYAPAFAGASAGMTKLITVAGGLRGAEA